MVGISSEGVGDPAASKRFNRRSSTHEIAFSGFDWMALDGKVNETVTGRSSPGPTGFSGCCTR